MSSRTGKKKRNYLRARGEYLSFISLRIASAELPPRTRRIQTRKWGKSQPLGTTSAHAENTDAALIDAYEYGNYLRARGEYPKSAGSFITWFSKMGQI